MKPLFTILILAVAGLFSCGDDEVLPLTPDLVSEIHAYDLDNNGNSSDIRLDFEVKDNLNVTEYRVMVIPSNSSNSFDKEMATTIPEVSYIEINPESFNVEYSIKRLPLGLLDTNGLQIQSDVEYIVAILVVGTGNQQLSEPSLPFILRNQGIYDGFYEAVMTDQFVTTLDCQRERTAFTEFQTVLKLQQSNYFGSLGCLETSTNCTEKLFDQGSIILEVSDQIVTFTYLINTVCGVYGPYEECFTCDSSDPCTGSFASTGTIEDELVFNIHYTGEDCAGLHETDLIMKRTPKRDI